MAPNGPATAKPIRQGAQAATNPVAVPYFLALELFWLMLLVMACVCSSVFRSHSEAEIATVAVTKATLAGLALLLAKVRLLHHWGVGAVDAPRLGRH